jgi:tRNA (adenine57-N1/adenine58-N1)-methyltransferase
VSLLDIHVDHPGPGPDDSHKLEILEAGTGHGALTLHLSRAIHAANPPVPKSPATTQGESEPEEAIYNGESVSDLHESNLDAWKAGRRAIVHTLDISSKHSKHAKKIVRGFRHGIYAENVDFHEGDVSDWIASQKVVRQTDEPFISHVFLDLPNAGQHLENAASVLRVNGQLAIFNPSITQIVECVERIREHKMPYLLEQVVELGAGNIREWDVRAVRPRASLRKAESSPVRKQEVDPASLDTVEEQQARDDETSSALSQEKEEWAMICRPKVGAQVVGGGFLALWRKMEPAQNIDPIE